MKYVLWLIGAAAVVLAILAAQMGVSGQDHESVQHDGGVVLRPIAKPCTSPDSALGVPSHRPCKERLSVRNAHYDPDCPEHWHIAPRPGWDIWQCMSSCEADLGRCEASCQTLEDQDERDECSRDCLGAFRACREACMSTPPDIDEGKSYCPEDYSATL